MRLIQDGDGFYCPEHNRQPEWCCERAAPKMTLADKEAQRRSFAYGNVHLSNPDVTREMVDEAAERLGSAATPEGQ